MRTSPAQIERVAATLVKRLVEKDVVKLAVPETTVKAKFVELLTKNFDQEAELERLAMAEAEKLVRQGAPGVKRESAVNSCPASGRASSTTSRPPCRSRPRVGERKKPNVMTAAMAARRTSRMMR